MWEAPMRQKATTLEGGEKPPPALASLCKSAAAATNRQAPALATRPGDGLAIKTPNSPLQVNSCAFSESHCPPKARRKERQKKKRPRFLDQEPCPFRRPLPTAASGHIVGKATTVGREPTDDVQGASWARQRASHVMLLRDEQAWSDDTTRHGATRLC